MHNNARMIQFHQGTTKSWPMANQTGSEEWNQRETKKEPQQIRFSPGQENDRDCRTRGKWILKVCDKTSDLVLASSERFPFAIKRKLPEGLKPTQTSIAPSAENTDPMECSHRE
jgi:hypothetical protein